MKMKMNNEFTDWVIGVLFFLIVTTCLFYMNKFLIPHSQYSMLEWWGIVMMAIVIKTGIDSWNRDE
jgi:hypothetical protein